MAAASSPLDVMLLIFDATDDKTVLRAAQVNRHWRHSAVPHPKFILPINVTLTNMNSTYLDICTQIERLVDIPRYALWLGVKTKLDLVLDIYGAEQGPRDDWKARLVDDEQTTQSYDELLDLFNDRFPAAFSKKELWWCMHTLHIRMNAEVSQRVVGFMCKHPAPYLHSMLIFVEPYIARAPLLPMALFQQVAPVLQQVWLHQIILPAQTLPTAILNVVQLVASCSDKRTIDKSWPTIDSSQLDALCHLTELSTDYYIQLNADASSPGGFLSRAESLRAVINRIGWLDEHAQALGRVPQLHLCLDDTEPNNMEPCLEVISKSSKPLHMLGGGRELPARERNVPWRESLICLRSSRDVLRLRVYDAIRYDLRHFATYLVWLDVRLSELHSLIRRRSLTLPKLEILCVTDGDKGHHLYYAEPSHSRDVLFLPRLHTIRLEGDASRKIWYTDDMGNVDWSEVDLRVLVHVGVDATEIELQLWNHQHLVCDSHCQLPEKGIATRGQPVDSPPDLATKSFWRLKSKSQASITASM
ncbi:hypothetical protein BKA62DRAFT_706422 [Auriculariales sp. MPI-PUGE-AT-0066]|nr:hypothetical protein BKA62DRAFT_706422 [Auriculariales sp. MPI-PUGE-AT-0066]